MSVATPSGATWVRFKKVVFFPLHPRYRVWFRRNHTCWSNLQICQRGSITVLLCLIHCLSIAFILILSLDSIDSTTDRSRRRFFARVRTRVRRQPRLHQPGRVSRRVDSLRRLSRRNFFRVDSSRRKFLTSVVVSDDPLRRGSSRQKIFRASVRRVGRSSPSRVLPTKNLSSECASCRTTLSVEGPPDKKSFERVCVVSDETLRRGSSRQKSFRACVRRVGRPSPSRVLPTKNLSSKCASCRTKLSVEGPPVKKVFERVCVVSDDPLRRGPPDKKSFERVCVVSDDPLRRGPPD
jgi:hypothetical protein